MANNFSTVKNNIVSEKFYLVRIKMGRRVTSDLSLSAGTTYTCTFKYDNCPSIKVNGISYTKVSGAPSSSEFSFNESTKLITINLGASLTTQQIIAFHYLFITSNKFRSGYETPTDTSTDIRLWVPRLINNPSFSVSIKDLREGYFSYQSSSISLVNNDYYYNQYFGEEDSFSNKEIDFFQCIVNTENTKLVFKGIIKSVNINKTLNINLDDRFSVLDDTFFSNATFRRSFIHTADYPNVDPAKILMPIPRIFGKRSPELISDNAMGEPNLNTLLEAHNANFSSTLSTSTNNSFICNVAGDNSSVVQYTLSGKTLLSGSTYKFTITSTEEVLRNDVFKRTSDNLDLEIINVLNSTEIIPSNSSSLNDGDIIERDRIAYVVVDDGVLNALPRSKFSTSVNANNVVILDIDSSGLAAGYFNPDTDKLYYVATQSSDDPRTHGEVIKVLLDDLGLTTNSSSFTQADSDLTANCLFTIPYTGQNEMPTHRTVLANIMKSTLSYITNNLDQEVEYHVFQIGSAEHTIYKRNILNNSFSINIDYKDIIPTIAVVNKHGHTDLSSDREVNTRESESDTDNASLYLNELNKVGASFEVFTDNLETVRDRILDYTAKRKAYYNYKTKGINFDSLIGDNETIEVEGLLDSDTQKTLKILSINFNNNETIIKSTDLLGF